jgi:hypothetical protein
MTPTVPDLRGKLGLVLGGVGPAGRERDGLERDLPPGPRIERAPHLPGRGRRCA